jgi:hypothetical protein
LRGCLGNGSLHICLVCNRALAHIEYGNRRK